MSTAVVTNLQDRRATVENRSSQRAVVTVRPGTGPPGPTGSSEVALSLRGTLVVGIGVIPLVFPSNKTIVRITAAVGVAPTGQAIIFDIKKNGVTILSTVVLSIQPNSTVALPIVPDDATILTGDILTVDVIQVGSLQPGAYATLVIEVA
jgi:hypothetical protein